MTARVTPGPRCPSCSASSRFRTLTEADQRVVDAMITTNPGTGPCAGRKCNDARCGLEFIELSQWTKPMQGGSK